MAAAVKNLALPRARSSWSVAGTASSFTIKMLGLKGFLRCQRSCEGDVLFQRLDLTDPDSIASTSKFIQDKFGRLDVLVNNAAICFNDPTLYGKVPHTPFEKQVSPRLISHATGVNACIQFFNIWAVDSLKRS